MITVVYAPQPTLSLAAAAALGVCAFTVRTHVFRLGQRFDSRRFRARESEKRRVIAARSGYCVLYQEDKPIRGTLIDINFHSVHLSSPLFWAVFI